MKKLVKKIIAVLMAATLAITINVSVFAGVCTVQLGCTSPLSYVGCQLSYLSAETFCDFLPASSGCKYQTFNSQVVLRVCTYGHYNYINNADHPCNTYHTVCGIVGWTCRYR